MKLKDKILNSLKAENHAISGSELAQMYGVSRNAIWLAIQELREDGYIIESKKNVGYLLKTDFSPLTEQEIREYLTENNSLIKDNFNFVLLDSVDSTNTYIKNNAEKMSTWTVVLTEEQTAGRGRLGRVFASPKYAGVYMSILLRLQLDLKLLPRITACTAVVACRAIERIIEKKPQIKWVNDIFIEGKKVVGILTESVMQVEQGNLDFIVVGIGVNFHKAAISEDLQEIATALFDKENFNNSMRAKFIAYFLQELKRELANLEKNTFFKEYKDRLFILGQTVQITNSTTSFVAKVKDINDSYNLIVELENGEEKTLTAGEVSLKQNK